MGDITLSAISYGDGYIVPAAGHLLPIQGNQALFSLLMNRFGGNGQNSFALPDLRSVTPAGLQYNICVQGYYPQHN